MKQRFVIALILIAICTIEARAQTPSAYRCGNSYSQTPCPGGVSVDTADSRSNAQKAQSDAMIQRDKATAESMEKSRRQEEEALRRQQGIVTPVQVNKNPNTEIKIAQPVRHVRKYNQRNPDNFIAKAPNEKKKTKPVTSTASP
jgi:hypothetical protein